MAHLLTREAAQRNVSLIAAYDLEHATELAERYRKLYPNFSDGLGYYQLADHTSDYRVGYSWHHR